jgi:hypothetical protein
MTVLTNRSFIHLIALKNQSISTPVRPIMDYEQDLFVYSKAAF